MCIIIIKLQAIAAIVLFIPAVYGLWRVLVNSALDITPNQNVPFTLGFKNGSMFVNNTWFTNSPYCTFDDDRFPITEVLCSRAGVVAFGYYIGNDKQNILEVRGIPIKPTHHCYLWNIDLEEIGNYSHKVMISVMKYQTTMLEDQAQWTMNFLQLGESPKAVLKQYSLSAIDKEISLTYNTTELVWEGTVNLESRAMTTWLFVSSLKGISDHHCFIRTSKVRFASPKYDMSMPDGDELLFMDVILTNKVIQDPLSHHVEIIVHSNMATFPEDGFDPLTQNLTRKWFLTVVDMKMTSNHIVIMTNLGAVKKWGVLGTLDIIPYDGSRWLQMFTCRIIPKGLNKTQEIFILLNEKKQHGYFYIYDLYLNSFIKLQVPVCDDKNIDTCVIQHVEISASLNIVRILLTHCNSIEYCDQLLYDYYFMEQTWILVVNLGNVSFQSFLFFPTNSYHVVFLNVDAIHQWTGTLSLRYNFTAEDGIVQNLIVSDDVLLVELSSLYVLYITYGSIHTHKVYVGSNSFLSIDYDDGDIYSFNYEDIKLRKVYWKEFTSLNIELDAVTKGLQPSVLDFKTTVKKGVYYLDKNEVITVEVELVGYSKMDHDINVIYDENIGLKVTEAYSSEIKVRNSVKGIKKTFSISLADSLVMTYTQSRQTCITFAPFYYEGYYAQQLKPQTMFILMGCPPGRHLHITTNVESSSTVLNLKNVNLHGNYYYETIYVELQKNEELQVTFYLNSEEKNPRPVEGIIHLVSNTVANSVLVKKKTEENHIRTITCVVTGDIDVHITLQSVDSLCLLEGRIVLHVTDTERSQRNLIIVISISLGVAISFVTLCITFAYFKKQTEKDHEVEAEIAQRQQQLRQLTSLKHYQDQMELNTNELSTTFATSCARRRSSIASGRRSTVVNQEQLQFFSDKFNK